MKITIIDEDGVVQAQHDLSSAAQRAALIRLCESLAVLTCGDMAVVAMCDDMAAVCRRRRTDDEALDMG